MFQLTSFDRVNSDSAKIRGLFVFPYCFFGLNVKSGIFFKLYVFIFLCSNREVCGVVGKWLGCPILPRLRKQIQHPQQAAPLSPLWLHHVQTMHGVRPPSFGPYGSKTSKYADVGGIMSVSLPDFCLVTEKLINGTREALCVPGSPGQSQTLPAGGGSSGMGSRRGSISSLSSVTSMLEEKDDEKIRCCHHCMDTLLKKQQKLDEKDHIPDIVKLYEVSLIIMELRPFCFSLCFIFCRYFGGLCFYSESFFF